MAATRLKSAEPADMKELVRIEASTAGQISARRGYKSVDFRRDISNMDFSIYRGILRGEVDLSVRIGRSHSGKSTTIATTHGFVAIPEHEGVVMAATVFRYPDHAYKHAFREPAKSPTGNVKYELKSGRLTFWVDLSAELSVSRSGKSLVIATTTKKNNPSNHGILVSKSPKRIKLSLEVFRPLQRDPEQLKLLD